MRPDRGKRYKRTHILKKGQFKKQLYSSWQYLRVLSEKFLSATAATYATFAHCEIGVKSNRSGLYLCPTLNA